MADGSQKRKIAILGGGIGGLVAAYELTNSPTLRNRYEVCVYQMGWRLGGKGASGRNLDEGMHDRIEEHGLHIWLGNYENAFRLMRNCYEECTQNNLAPGSPLQSWDDAFKKQNLITMMEQIDGARKPWSITMPPNDSEPGVGRQCISIIGTIRRIIELLQGVQQELPAVPHVTKASARDFMARASNVVGRLVDQFEKNRRADYENLVSLLEGFTLEFKSTVVDKSAETDEQRRRRILVELAVTLAKATLKDVLLQNERSFDVVDHYDFREWLRKHGASHESVESAPVRCCYEIVFGYKDGDGNPSFAAGVATRFVLRWVLTYHGALIYKMQAGMGDCVFTPLYLVLKHRGVKFKFFHRVETLELSDDKSTVDRIIMDEQVHLTVSEYHPLEPIKGIPCWPAEPRFQDQIDPTQTTRLRQLKRDYPGLEPLESAFSPWNERSDKTTVTLDRGEHFHDVVLAIPTGALPIHCKELIDANPRFADMVRGVQTVATQSFQLWLNKDRSELGWNADPTILDSYLDSWADFSHLEPRESFPPDSVHSIAYMCKALGEPESTPPPGSHPDFPLEQTTRVKNWSRDDFLNGNPGMRPIWPNSYDDHGFKWEWLTDLTSASGADRFDAQYWCANVNPSDRYVQALTDTTRYRLRADESGFNNVILAGDWTRTGINAGCIEGATLGGMQAARAISGSPQEISGEHDFCPELRNGCLQVVLSPLFFLVNLLRRLKNLICKFLCGTGSAPQPPPLPATPRYVERGGEQTFPQPIGFSDVNVDAYLLNADANKLTQLCDKFLNNPSGGAVNYRPIAVLPRVMLAVVTIPECMPRNAPEYDIGFIHEIDVGIWIPVIATGLGQTVHLAWFLPYVFVDHPWAVACGREIYGFPKEMSKIVIPKTDSSTRLSVCGPAVQIPDPNVEVPELEILKITGTSPLAFDRTWETTQMHEAFADLRAAFVDECKMLDVPGFKPQSADSLFDFANPTLVFLKQFRDIANGRNACYQAIVEATARVVKFTSGGRMSGSYSLETADLVSHKVRADLGWTGAEPVQGAWNFRFSFDMENGREVWRA